MMRRIRALKSSIWLAQLLQDTRYALRMVRRTPGFSAVVVLTLAVGIGMNTAVFSVINAVLVRPLSYPDPDRLLWVGTLDERTNDQLATSVNFLAWREQAASFERMAAYDTQDARIGIADAIVQARIASVTEDFWEISGARPVLGRLPRSGEAALLLSDSFFERSFQRDPNIVGRPVTMNGRQVVVAGVLPEGFRIQLPPPSPWSGLDPRDINAYRVMVVRPPDPQRPAVMLLDVIAKLKPGVAIDHARAELDTIRARGATGDRDFAFRTMRVVPLSEKLVGRAREPLLILLAAVILVLVIACANIANLLLARASARQKEIAIRTALGASRSRVLRQCLVESLVLALLGGAGGVLLARSAVTFMLRLIPQAVPRLAETTIDGQVLTFALCAAIGTAFLFGVGPAIALWKTDVHDALKDGANTSSAASGSLRVKKLLVAIEMALTVVLLSGAGLMVKSFWRMTAYPPGFDPERVLTMKYQFTGPQYRDEQKRRAYVEELLRRVEAMPGVEAGGITSNDDGLMRLFIEGEAPMRDERRPAVPVSSTSAGYARAIGMRLVSGRWLSDVEPTPVFVMNESMAGRYFSGQDPIGRRILLPWVNNSSYATVVGVVADLKYSKLDANPEPRLFTDYGHAPTFGMMVVMRMAGTPQPAAAAIRGRLSDIDKTQPIFDVKVLEDALADSIAPRRFNLFLLGAFAAAALLLALIGIYGVIAYSVAHRTREIAVRLALGAQRHDVVAMVVRQGMGMALAGIGIGLAAAAGLTRVIASLLYEVEPTDVPTFAVVVAIAGLVALAACVIPARRAAATDLLGALRAD